MLGEMRLLGDVFGHFGILVGTPGVMIHGMASQDVGEIGVSSRLGLILNAF